MRHDNFNNLFIFKINEIVIFAALLGIFSVSLTLGSESIAFTVTPSLLEINLSPGENWNSGLKIFNNNSTDLTVYVSAVNLSDKSVPILNEDSEIYGHSLAKWVKFKDNAVTILGKQSVFLPFSLQLPADAPPGSHAAAILIGTQPLSGKTQELKSAGFISSILSVRVSGEKRVGGAIKSFIAENNFYRELKVKFSLNFENTGNVNLNPSGKIKIFNYQGEEKGDIILSAEALAVLPGKSREFIFNWEREKSGSGMGRYKAAAVLTFGNPAQNIVKETYFWIMPINFIFGIISLLFLLPLFLFFAGKTIRAYVHKVMEGEFPVSDLPPVKNYQPVPVISAWNPLMIIMVIGLLSVSAGAGVRYAVESRKSLFVGAPELALKQTASIIHQTYFLSASETDNRFNEVEILKEDGGQMSLPELFRRFLPVFDKDFLSQTFNDDFTAFRYYDANGSWPGYVAKIKDSQVLAPVIAPILENYAARFYISPETLGEFKDGSVLGIKTRYAIGSRPGSAFNYGLFNEYLVISASFDGFKLALKSLGAIP
ncbi:MAG: hypothetical protein HYY86_00475 [Candidatus Harrisonbacteria bacterium]|nr:hypothetical protein [Candidatus Harrisonbacteria bacterium]